MYNDIRTKTEYIILHHFGVDAYYDSIDMQKTSCKNSFNKHPEYFYHYVILSNGEIIKGNKEDRIVLHANNNTINNISIAVCLWGNLSKREPTQKQINTLISLLKELTKKYNIKKENILGHRDVGVSWTECPGNLFYKILPDIRLEVFMENWKKEILNWAVKEGIIKTPEAHKNLDTFFTKAETLAILKNIIERGKKNE